MQTWSTRYGFELCALGTLSPLHWVSKGQSPEVWLAQITLGLRQQRQQLLHVVHTVQVIYNMSDVLINELSLRQLLNINQLAEFS